MDEQVDGVLRAWSDLEEALAIGEDDDFGIRTGADMSIAGTDGNRRYQLRTRMLS